ncbi:MULTISPECIES: hypothetical protein [unclassified Pseudoalteromonas]|jgi:hypothetical protein|uniref:hypothetical protein n=1 Tax=unclassified Pseudoalteromonas TaxID=194690 RepID=UPI0007308DD6|nr:MULTISPECIES: hypothetical protein [unclassified Pseudoalteromonas]KTD97806.1 hypothetical protein ATS71_04155 [Pseudoalteromonas sp. H71]KTF14320.1 hypothetical protein ATS76_04165 [Pseudoalteromonas sp. 10-33]
MTKNSTHTTLFALLILLISVNVNANDACQLPDKPTMNESKRYIQCLDTQLDKAKQEQGTWVQKRKYELVQSEEATGNTQVLQLFMRSIKNNEKYIESACQWRYILQLPNAKAAAISYKHCEIQLVNQFTESLKQPL